MAVRGLGELLVRENVIDIQQLENAKREQKMTGGRLGTALVKLGYVKDAELTSFLAQQYNVPAIDIDSFDIDAKVLQMVPKNICEKHGVIPIQQSGNSLVVAMADPSNMLVRDELGFLTRSRIEVVVAAETSIRNAIDRYYKSAVNYESIMNKMERENQGQVTATAESAEIVDLDKNQDDAPVVQFVNLMLTEAIKLKASDIHIEPYEKRFRIRYRVDGVLWEKIQPPQGMLGSVISRIKIMSKLDIAERRRPQDGRLKIRLKNGQEVDFRVSVVPTLFGEKIVMRLLDKGNLSLDIAKLGFFPSDLEKFKNGISSPNGIVLITGPTGSGKSTTIYSALAELNKPGVNISTAEDPVEYNIDGINQVQVNPDVDLTFASALRSFLRQDPDIVMVGEIRDFETAEIAFKAALTGHLVVSTLHTNDAPSTIHRLLNMGIEPFLVASAVNTVVAQRLVRKNCESCKTVHSVDPAVLTKVGFTNEELKGFEYYAGEGCANCNDTGYKGRRPIFEVLECNEAVREMILSGASPTEIKKTAMKSGMRSLRRSGLELVKQGVTTIEEVLETSVED